MKIVIASDNQHKLIEIKQMLAPLGLKIITKAEAGITAEVEETGLTFADNALLKAREISLTTGLCAIADDSGIAVDALDGAPGVFSARYAATDELRNQKLLHNLKDIKDEDRTAQYVCAITFYIPTGENFTVLGKCDGIITHSPEGQNGFGYDPIFFCREYNKTYACLTPEQKNKISHRGKALARFSEILTGYIAP